MKTFDNMKLVKEIEKFPCIYDLSSDERTRKYCDKAWKNVSEIVGDTETSCKERWKNIRTVFARSFKILQSKRKRKPYYLADHLEFLYAHMKCSKNSDIINSIKLKRSKSPIIWANDNSKPSKTPIIWDNDNSKPLKTPIIWDNIIQNVDESKENEIIENDPLENHQDHIEISTKEHKINVKLRKHLNNINKDMNNSIDYLFKKIENDHVKDSEEHFLLGLLPDMKRLDFKRQRKFKMGITALLNELHDDQQMEQNNINNTSS